MKSTTSFSRTRRDQNPDDTENLVESEDHQYDSLAKKVIAAISGLCVVTIIAILAHYSITSNQNQSVDGLDFDFSEREARTGAEAAEALIEEINRFADQDIEQQILENNNRETRFFNWFKSDDDNKKNKQQVPTSTTTWTSWSSWSSSRPKTQSSWSSWSSSWSSWSSTQKQHTSQGSSQASLKRSLQKMSKSALIGLALKTTKDLGIKANSLSQLKKKFKDQQKTCNTAGLFDQLDQVKKVCYKQVFDLTFIIDGSGSITANDYKKSLDFVKNVVNMLDMDDSYNSTHVNLIQFSNKVKKYAELEGDKWSLFRTLGQMKNDQMGSNTMTDDALEFAYNQIRGRSNSVKQAIIVLTDGQSTNGGVDRAAQKLHRIGATMFAIGVGSGVDEKELNEIASTPSVDHKFEINDFQALRKILPAISTKICNTIAIDQARQVCRQRIFDLTIVVDGSGSIDKADFAKAVKFIGDLVNTLGISAKGINVKLIQFSDRVRVYTKLTGNKSYIDQALATLGKEQMNSVTYTNKALETAYNEIRHYKRPVDQVVMVMTDGKSTDGNLSAARKVQGLGAKVFAIGVGSGIDQGELEEIASNPDKDHLFEIDDFNALDRILAKFTKEICQSAF